MKIKKQKLKRVTMTEEKIISFSEHIAIHSKTDDPSKVAKEASYSELQDRIYTIAESFNQTIKNEIDKAIDELDSWVYSDQDDPLGKPTSYRIPKSLSFSYIYLLVKIQAVKGDTVSAPRYHMEIIRCLMPPEPIQGTVLYEVDILTRLYTMIWDLPDADFFRLGMQEDFKLTDECKRSIKAFSDGSLLAFCQDKQKFFLSALEKAVKAQAKASKLSILNF